jgi:hypothetical protein
MKFGFPNAYDIYMHDQRLLQFGVKSVDVLKKKDVAFF